MARKSTIESVKRIRKCVEAKKITRAKLKSTIMNKAIAPEERFAAQ